MYLNIAQKIFGIAIVILALMATVAVFSIRLTAEISEELDSVAGTQLPLSHTIGQINVRILEQGLLLQRLFALPEDSPQAIARINALGDELNADFIKAHKLIAIEEHANRPPETIFALDRSLSVVEREYRVLEQHSLDLLARHTAGDDAAFNALLPNLNLLQNAVDDEIANLRRHFEGIADDAIMRADAAEKFLLLFNAGLTALSAVLGLGFASVVTFVLVRNVRNLVSATEAVEAGDLDTELAVVSRDEVGKLTASFNGMVEGLRMKERIKDTFGKYMDPRVVAKLLENPEFMHLGGERREMTVMFIDLKGYTSISELLRPDDLIRMLNMFLGHMTDAISANLGVINDFQGDAVMAFWGPPFTAPDEHATLACKAALEALENFDRFRQDVAAELGPQAEGLDLDMRIGISSGHMIAGNIGSAASRKFSVIGDAVNLGARLEGANKNYGTRIMMSEYTRNLVPLTVHVRELDLVRVKGKSEPTRIFELRPEEPEVDRFLDGLAAYRVQDWEKAEQAFKSHLTTAPTDPVPDVFLDRIAHLKANPPGPGWDGVWDFQTK